MTAEPTAEMVLAADAVFKRRYYQAWEKLDDSEGATLIREMLTAAMQALTRRPADDEVKRLRAENERLQDVLDTERYKVAIGVQEVARAIQGRRWLSQPGRGSYTYDDERYQQEFGAAIDEIQASLKPLSAIAQDWSDCPRDPLRVAANRSAALSSSRSEGGGE